MGIIERLTAIEKKKRYNKIMRINEQDLASDARPETKPFMDRWSVRHGVGCFLIGLIKPNRSGKMFVSSVAFEIAEETLARNKEEQFFRHEPVVNKVGDVIANQIGYEIGSAIINEILGEEEEEEYLEEELEELEEYEI